MSFWDFMRGPASARLLVDFGVEVGIPATKLLTGTNLSLAQLADPNVQLCAAQELRVVENLLRHSKTPTELGLMVGSRYHFSTYGLWGFGLISSATAGDAMALALRFLPLTYAFTVISYHEEGRYGVLSFGAPELDDHTKRFLVARDMAAATELMNEMIGHGFSLSRFTLRGLRGPFERSQPISSRVFGASIEYGSKVNSLEFERSMLSHPLPQANPLTVSMCEQMCSQLMERRLARSGTASMIRQYLSSTHAHSLPHLAGMARMTNMSQRTLKRRLQEEGTSFRELTSESRSAMAKELLNEEHLSLTEIAERLGYCDLSSFSQAFKRWHGLAPSAFRSKIKP